MTAIHIELPEHSSYGEIMKAYFSLMRGFGIELGMRCDAKLTEQEGPEWWSDLIAQRRLDGRWKGTVNLNDPSITLPEYVWGQDSPLALVLSSKPQSKILAKKIHHARNTWLHFSEAPGPVELGEVAALIKQFASLNGLKVEAPAARMVKRTQRIATGQYQPYHDVVAKWLEAHPPAASDADPSHAASADEPTVDAPSESVDVPAPALERRPPIGGRWGGDVPPVRYVPSRTGDLVDPTTGRGLRVDVDAGDWERKRRLWLAPNPMGGIWIDDRDGAVGGYVHGVARLLGYLGAEPDDGQARGFLLPHYYELDEGRIVDLDSGERLSDAVSPGARGEAIALESAVAAASDEHAGLRLTNYGDLVATSASGVERVAVVEPETWFPGRLA